MQHPDSRPVVNTSTHFLPPEVLLSPEVSPSHHPTASPRAPVPIAPWPHIPRGPEATVLPTPSLQHYPRRPRLVLLDFPQQEV